MTDRSHRLDSLRRAAGERILVIDGAMGTMIQAERPEEADYRGTRFADWSVDLKGNNDLLSLTKPDLIRRIHKAFLDAGADIVETNTFSATTIAQADYALEEIARELNVVGARLAREAADAKTAETPDRPRFVAGAIGPTNRTLSLSPDVNDPGYRAVTFDQVRDTYREATSGLIEGGVDIIMIETIFDTLNAKAAIYAVEEAFDDAGFRLPILISGTITDKSGRTLSGQTADAFWHSIRHADPFAVGFNCALGAQDLRPYVEMVGRVADTLVSVYPNAGLPNAFGEYDETPEMMATELGDWARSGLINLIGGCCGTTPDHIRAIADAVDGVSPRPIPEIAPAMRLSGLEAVTFAA